MTISVYVITPGKDEQMFLMRPETKIIELCVKYCKIMGFVLEEMTFTCNKRTININKSSAELGFTDTYVIRAERLFKFQGHQSTVVQLDDGILHKTLHESLDVTRVEELNNIIKILPDEILPLVNNETLPFYKTIVDHNGDDETWCIMGQCDTDLEQALSNQSDLTKWDLADVLARVVNLYYLAKDFDVLHLDFKLGNIGVRTDKSFLMLDIDSMYLFRDQDSSRIGFPTGSHDLYKFCSRRIEPNVIRAAQLHHTLVNPFSGDNFMEPDELDNQLYLKKERDGNDTDVTFIFRFIADTQVAFVLACCCCALTAKPHLNGDWPHSPGFKALRDQLTHYNTFFFFQTKTKKKERYKEFKPFMTTLEHFIELTAKHLDTSIPDEVQGYIMEINKRYAKFVAILDHRRNERIANCFATFTDITL